MDVTAPGRQLHQQFLLLGNMTGKSADEIIGVVGRPSSISSMAHGQMLLQWQATGCHMSLMFDEDRRFLKIAHQYAKYAEFSAGSYALPPETDHSVAKIIGLIVGLIVGIGMLITAFS